MAERHLNVTSARLGLVLAASGVAAGVLAVFFSQPGSPWAAVVWTLLGFDALRIGHRAYWDRKKDAAFANGDVTPEGVYTRAAARREFVRNIGQSLFVIIGVWSLVTLGSSGIALVFRAESLQELAAQVEMMGWRDFLFSKFFVASFIYVQFLLWLNSKLDETVPKRMRLARQLHDYDKELKRQGRS